MSSGDNFLQTGGLSPSEAQVAPLLPLVRARLWPAADVVDAPLWIHGVSVGEVELVRGLLQAVRAMRPELEVLLTSTTPAGVALLDRRFRGSGGVTLRPFPLDLPFTVRRFFGASRARVLVLVETELWPSVLREARRRAVAVLLVNAKLSERSARRYGLVRGLFAGALGAVSHVAARSSEDAARFVSIGIPAERVSVEGDMKLDGELPPAPAFEGELARLRRGRPAWIAGSVADEELDLVIDAHLSLRRSLDAFLVLAPRRPESFGAAAKRLKDAGLAFASRSALPAAGEADVFLLDSIGELAATYRLADVAFLGGTVAPRGGHNVLEPLRAGLPTIHGPSTSSIRTTLEAARGAVYALGEPADLPRILAALLADEEQRRRAATVAAGLFERSAGATRRAARRALDLLDAAGPGEAGGFGGCGTGRLERSESRGLWRGPKGRAVTAESASGAPIKSPV